MNWQKLRNVKALAGSARTHVAGMLKGEPSLESSKLSGTLEPMEEAARKEAEAEAKAKEKDKEK